MKIAKQNKQGVLFDTFFQAETYLEKQGYHCEHDHWVQDKKPIATVVAKSDGIKIEFKKPIATMVAKQNDTIH